MTIIELKKGLLDKMQSILPTSQYNYYSKAVTEGYQRPCFFTQLKANDLSFNNYNSRNNNFTFYITYLGVNSDEVDMLEKINLLKNAFGMFVRIGNRAVKIEDFSWEYVGNEGEILEINIDIQYLEKIDHTEEAPKMTQIDTKYKKY